MRSTFLLVPFLFGVAALGFTGCGSNSDTSPSAAAGIPLAIPNPASGKSSEAKPAVADSVRPAQVDELIQKARAAVATGRGATAVEALSQAIGLTPGDSELFHLRADVYTLIGEFANARADYSLAIQADSGNAALYNARGHFLMNRGLNAEAIQDFDQALQLNPALLAALNNRGLIRLAEQNYDAAVADFSKALEQNSQYADALNNRGFAKMKQDKLDDALADLRQAVRLQPGYTVAWNNCGLVLMQQEKFTEAAEAFSEAVKQAPLDVRWLNNRRTAWQKAGNFEAAGRDATRLQWLSGLTALTARISEKPSDVDAWLTRAELLVQGAEYKAAIQDYSRVLSISPGNTNALTGRATAWLKAGDLKNALADCDESLVIQPSTRTYALRGEAWFALAEFDNAISDFEAAGTLNPQLAVAYRQRAAKRQEQGHAGEAAEDLQKADHIDKALAGELSPPPTAATESETQAQ
ncbi:MAG: tetratricopeptide repeat protein [Planctomycetaceae bacterium]